VEETEPKWGGAKKRKCKGRQRKKRSNVVPWLRRRRFGSYPGEKPKEGQRFCKGALCDGRGLPIRRSLEWEGLSFERNSEKEKKKD